MEAIVISPYNLKLTSGKAIFSDWEIFAPNHNSTGINISSAKDIIGNNKRIKTTNIFFINYFTTLFAVCEYILKNLLVMERTFVILQLIILPIIINHLNVTLLMSSYPRHVPPYPCRIYIHHLCNRLGVSIGNHILGVINEGGEY